MSKIKLEFEKGGSFEATLFTEEAPETCKKFSEKLPFKLQFYQSIVSGQAMVALPDQFSMPRENQRVAGIPPGSLCFLVRDDVVLVPDEIYIAYGLFISRGLTLDEKQPVNVFARIDSNLDELGKIGKRVLMEGAEFVNFSLIPEE